MRRLLPVLTILLLATAAPGQDVDGDPCPLATRKLAGRVKRPKSAAVVDRGQLENFVVAHTPRMQPLARFVGDNLRHISQADFEAALHQSVDRLVTAVAQLPPDTRVVLYDPPSQRSSSGRWTANLMVEYLAAHHPELLKRVELKTSFTEADFTKPLHVILVDDAGYSGASVLDETISGMRGWHNSLTDAERARLHFHLVIPFLTNEAKRNFTERTPGTPHLYDVGNIETVEEALARSPLTPDQKDLFRHSYAVLSDSVLTYFDHNVADNFLHSGLASMRGGQQSLAEGAVVAPNGTPTKKVPFLQRPPKPYGPRR